MEISIKNIKVLRNVRTEIKDVSDLMTDIKENGLLHPIGLWRDKDFYYVVYGHRRFLALKKLGRKNLEVGKDVKIIEGDLSLQDILVLNLTENLHRQDNSPSELGKGISDLKEIGLSISEIASRLSIPKVRAETALRIFAKVPEKERKNIGYIGSGQSQNKKGKISASVADKILSLRVKQRDINELFEIARMQELSAGDVYLIGQLLSEGKTLKQAVEAREDYVIKTADFVVKKEEFEKIMIPFKSYMMAVIRGKEKINKNLFYES